MTYTIPKKLVVIEDICGIGRCSQSVSIPIISACAVQACPVITSIFSNHTGYTSFYKSDISPSLTDFFAAWEIQQFQFDGIYCGYLGNISQMEDVKAFQTSQPSIPFFVDPVMGDHGKMYKSLPEIYLSCMKKFIKQATILTPNLTEACLLTDTPYTEQVNPDFLQELIDKMQVFQLKSIIITGIAKEHSIGNFIFDSTTNSYEFLEFPLVNKSRPGTGDIFASIVFANVLKGVPLVKAVSIASEFICACTKASDEALVPVLEGVIFEALLPLLYQH